MRKLTFNLATKSWTNMNKKKYNEELARTQKEYRERINDPSYVAPEILMSNKRSPYIQSIIIDEPKNDMSNYINQKIESVPADEVIDLGDEMKKKYLGY